MRRRFSYGQVLVAVVVLVVAVVAIGQVTKSKKGVGDPNAPDDARFTTCPTSSANACLDQLAQAWGSDAHRLPSVAVPGAMKYERGFIANKGKPPAGFLVFQTKINGSAQPMEITLRISPATAAPYDPKHRGGKLRKLPSGRSYLDFSSPKHSGPFVEHLADLELVVAYDSPTSPAELRAKKLELLDSATTAR